MEVTAQSAPAPSSAETGRRWGGSAMSAPLADYWREPRVAYPCDRIGIVRVSSPYSRAGEMMIDLDHPQILTLFTQHRASRRTDNAAFLIWYLENYYRLETVEAIDAICDQPGDKGVDGIFVNDNNQTITIFQSRIYQSADAVVGDKALREFAGSITQFETAEKISALIKAAGDAQVARLAHRLDLINKVATHELRGEFITNIDMDANGGAFIDASPHITFVGKTILTTSYISDSRYIPPHDYRSFDITGFQATEYVVDADTRAVIAPIKAAELVSLDGISDQSV